MVTETLSDKRKELEKCLYWNEVDYVEGYKLISIKNVKRLLDLIQEQDKQFISELREVLKKTKIVPNNETDCYEVFFNGDKKKLIARYTELNSRVDDEIVDLIIDKLAGADLI